MPHHGGGSITICYMWSLRCGVLLMSFLVGLLTHIYGVGNGKNRHPQSVLIAQLPNTRACCGVTLHYAGEPTTKRCYTHGSKRHGRMGGAIHRVQFHFTFRIHGPQQVHRAETMACAIATNMAPEGNEIVFGNQGIRISQGYTRPTQGRSQRPRLSVCVICGSYGCGHRSDSGRRGESGSY